MPWQKRFKVRAVKIARNLGFAVLLAGLALPAYAQLPHLGKKKPAAQPADTSQAPDKVLYDRATDEIKHGKFEVARLQLQALLNTYPESEYLAKAKLAVADSYYKEGGTGNLDLAIDEYKSFITFFPFLDEAAYAQMQVAMTHYRRMYKADRDRTEAQLAEQEFQVFLQKYPDSPLKAQSEQHLREVQEVLAEGDFRIASYYMVRKSYKAASARLADIASRYPLYSRSDEVLWMLGNIWEKAPMQTKQEEAVAAARKAYAGAVYTRLVQDYPLSKMVPEAKERLKRLGLPVPQPDPTALARMQKEQQMPRPHEGLLAFTHAADIIHSGPDVSRSARVGDPTMTPPDDNATEGETLHRASMTRMSVAASPSGGDAAGGTASPTTPGTSAPVTMETVSPDGTVLPTTTSPATPVPATPLGSGTPVTGSTTPAGSTAAVGTSSSTTSTTPATGSAPTPAGTAPATGTATPQTATTQPCPDTKNTKKKDNSSDKDQQGCSESKKDESSSKKKTGIKKIIPF
jgi:outer membrane protein assembly factor BamD